MKKINTLTFKNIKEKIRKNEVLLTIGLILAVVAIVIFVVPSGAYAAGFAESLGLWVFRIIAFMLQLYVALLAILIAFMSVIFDWVAGFGVFSQGTINEGLLRGWTLLVNVANLVFILILLFIGIATIFRVEQFSIRRLFVRVIVAVLLINFSFFFTKIITNGADTIQNIFTNGAVVFPECREAGVPISCTIGNLVGIGDLNWESSVGGQMEIFDTLMATDSTDAALDVAIKSAFMMVFFSIFLFAIAIVTILLLVRMVVLWILATISPFAYVAMILPSTRPYSSQWWNALFRWALLGPLTLILINVGILVMTPMQVVVDNMPGGNINVGLSQVVLNGVQGLGLLIVASIFMIGSLMVARQMGGSIAGAIVNNANKGAKNLGKWAGGKASGAVLGRKDSKTGKRTGGLIRRAPGLKQASQALEGRAKARQQAGLSREKDYQKGVTAKTGKYRKKAILGGKHFDETADPEYKKRISEGIKENKDPGNYVSAEHQYAIMDQAIKDGDKEKAMIAHGSIGANKDMTTRNDVRGNDFRAATDRMQAAGFIDEKQAVGHKNVARKDSQKRIEKMREKKGKEGKKKPGKTYVDEFGVKRDEEGNAV
ncbi:hypothetical protein ACFL1U_00510 [Patescibacteria group bacterium]